MSTLKTPKESPTNQIQGDPLLSQATVERTQQILTLATREDIVDWLYKKGGKIDLYNICKLGWPRSRVEAYEEKCEEFKRRQSREYTLPNDPRALYQIVIGSRPTYEDTIFYEIYNTFFPDESITWTMKSKEFEDWYTTPDQSGKTGEDYILGAIKDKFGKTWKSTVAIINASRKLQNRGILSGNMSGIIKQLPDHIKNSLDLSSPTVAKKKILSNPEEMVERGQGLSRGKKKPNPVDSLRNWSIAQEDRDLMGGLFMEGIARMNHTGSMLNLLRDYREETIQKRPEELAMMDEIGDSDSDTEKIAKEEERIRYLVLDAHLKQLLLHYPQNGARMYVSYFIRALGRLGVPPMMFVPKYIRLDRNKSNTVHIQLHPIFFECIGKDTILDIVSRTIVSVEQSHERMGIASKGTPELLDLEVTSM